MGQFQNKLLIPYNRNFGNLEEMIIQLYQKGITTRETAQKEALHVLIGITPSGEKHVIDESTLAYKELLDHQSILIT